MSGLPREVIKWLQSLDLSYSVKNPKWNFANGLLISEIFARYYPSEQLLEPHKFYKGESAGLKRSNWVGWSAVEQLQKFFKLHNIVIPQEACDAVMNCQIDAASLFVENLYTLLTGRRVQRPPAKESGSIDYDHPHFALPTTSEIIRRVAKSPAKAQTIVEKHNDYIKHLRGNLTTPAELHPALQHLTTSPKAEQSQSHPNPWPLPVHRFDERDQRMKANAEELHTHAHRHAHQHENAAEVAAATSKSMSGDMPPVPIRVHQIVS
ncbi:spermatogenesis-associated protein 4 [Rhizophlyctis rosea]|nr:spermatogenesis-associated protein 4 [Rhizophlyctis rosea]